MIAYFVPGSLMFFLCELIGVDPVLALLWYCLIATVMEIGVKLQRKEPIGPGILWLNVLMLACFGMGMFFVYLVGLFFVYLVF
jgi:hypothetical protein